MKRHRNSDTKTGNIEPQQNYRIGTVAWNKPILSSLTDNSIFSNFWLREEAQQNRPLGSRGRNSASGSGGRGVDTWPRHTNGIKMHAVFMLLQNDTRPTLPPLYKGRVRQDAFPKSLAKLPWKPYKIMCNYVITYV